MTFKRFKKLFACTCAVLLTLTCMMAVGCGRTDRTLIGWVYAGTPVSSMTMSVYDTNGNMVIKSDSISVDEQGAIFIESSQKLPSDFRIVAEGGMLNGEEFSARLSADIRGYRAESDTIYVNPATTMASAYRDKLPQASVAEAADVVKGFLEIPESFELGSGAHLSSEHFNISQFLDEARDNGGVNAFIEKLLAEMAADKTHPFQEPLPLQGAGAWLAKTLAEGAVSYVGGELMGWGLETAGINFGEEDHTAEELANIQAGMAEMKAEMAQMNMKLDAISTQLKNIKTQLEQMLKQITHQQALSEYGNRVEQLDNLISSINMIRRDLNNFVHNPPSDPEPARQRLIDRIQANIIDHADVIHSKLVGQSGEKPLLTLWREIVYEDRFLDSDDYDKVKAQFDLFKQYQDSILLLQVEYYHAIETAPGENKEIILDCIKNYESHIEQQEALLARPIEKYTVIDTRYDVMYYSENIELGKPASTFQIADKSKSQVKSYMSEFAGSAYAGSDQWKPLNNVLGTLVNDHSFSKEQYFLSDYLIARGWPGTSVHLVTVVPFFIPDGNLRYLLYSSTHFKTVIDYPEAGLDKPGLALIMAYRQVTAKDYGYEHLK